MASSSDPGNGKYIVLCLGLLIGFVVGFVMLLSSLPINNGASDYDVYASKPAPRQQPSFDFYKYLPGSSGRSNSGRQDPAPVPDQGSVQQSVASADIPSSVSAPLTRVVPANAQIIAPASVLRESQTPSVDSQDAASGGNVMEGTVNRNGQYAEVPANYTVQQSYFLQVGRFGHHQDAQAMRAQVLMLGLEAFIVARVEADGVTAHRVRVGPYFDQNLLTEAKKRLRRGGINYEIVRVTG